MCVCGRVGAEALLLSTEARHQASPTSGTPPPKHNWRRRNARHQRESFTITAMIIGTLEIFTMYQSPKFACGCITRKAHTKSLITCQNTFGIQVLKIVKLKPPCESFFKCACGTTLTFYLLRVVFSPSVCFQGRIGARQTAAAMFLPLKKKNTH